MAVGIVGVPVIDRHPFHPLEPRSLSASAISSRVKAQVGHPSGVLGRHRELEMVPVLLAVSGEDLCVGVVGSRVEHSGFSADAGHTVALQARDMLRERRGTKTAAAMADDPHHDDDAPVWRSGGQGQRRPPSTAEGRASCGAAASLERLASVARFLRGPHHLANEALRSLGALVAVTDAAGARIEVIVP